MGNYKMYLDDVRELPEEFQKEWITVRSSSETISYVKAHGLPEFISFDHDLGGSDTTMVFLRWLERETNIIQENDPPEYVVHSSNPAGAANIRSFMESWKRFRNSCAENS